MTTKTSLDMLSWRWAKDMTEGVTTERVQAHAAILTDARTRTTTGTMALIMMTNWLKAPMKMGWLAELRSRQVARKAKVTTTRAVQFDPPNAVGLCSV